MSDQHTNLEAKVITTSKGVKLTLLGISPLLIAKLQGTGVLPPVPTRKYKLDFPGPDGEDQYQEDELTEEDLQDDEEKARWKEYSDKRNEILTKRNDGFLKAIFAKGVEVDLSQLDVWKETMEYLELEVPDKPLAQKVEYIQTEAIGNTEDMVEIITGVLGQSGIPEEDLAEVRGMFRDSLRPETAGEPIDPEE
jgi:hypothetical protein